MCYCVCIWLRKTLSGHLSYAVSSPRDFDPTWVSLLSCLMKVRDIKKCRTNKEFKFLNLFTCKAQFGKTATLEKDNQTATIWELTGDATSVGQMLGNSQMGWWVHFLSLPEPIWLCGSLHFRLFQSKHWHICILIDAHLCLFSSPPAAEWPDAGGAVLRDLEVVLTAAQSAEQTCWSGSCVTRRPRWEERYHRQVKVT